MVSQDQTFQLDILYADQDILVCIKPARVLSTDEPGGLPSLVRTALGDEKADVRTVHRLDRVVSGVMVLARNAKAASELSRQIREDVFEKEYLAVVHGKPEVTNGTLTDLLYRDKTRKMTMVASEPAKGVQEAILDYEIVNDSQNMSRVKILLRTGRTHQIRVQFSSRNMPLEVSPYGLCQDNENCYLQALSPRYGVTSYRVDRMSDITLTEEKRVPCPELTGKNLTRHANQLFQMFAGDTTTVKMRFHRSLTNVVMDRFGRDTMLIPDGEEHFVFTVNVAVSPMFLSWVVGFGSKAKILHPQSVVDECLALCREAMEQY